MGADAKETLLDNFDLSDSCSDELMEFFNENDRIKGFMSSNKPYGKKVKLIVMDLFNNLILNNKASFYEMGYSPEKMKELITIIFRKII
jgi:hypothetical protein